MKALRNSSRAAGVSWLPFPCIRTHHIGPLALVVLTFFVTRILDRYSCSFPSSASFSSHSSPLFLSDGYGSGAEDLQSIFVSGRLNWPQNGYGSKLSLRIYVYEEWEIDGLKELMRGRDGTISPENCLKGQWGTQLNHVLRYLWAQCEGHEFDSEMRWILKVLTA